MNQMASSIRQIHRSFIRIHVLTLALAEGEVYGALVQERLAQYGYRANPGTLYPVLHSLQTGGLLTVHPRAVEGKRRLYYRVTRRGCLFLLHMKPLVQELSSVLLDADLPLEL